MNWAAPNHKWVGSSNEAKQRGGFYRTNREVKQRKYEIGYSYKIALFGLLYWEFPSYIIIILFISSDWLNLKSVFL